MATTAIASPATPRAPRWLVGLALALGVLALLVAGALSLIPSEQVLALRAGSALQSALGVPVRVGALHWQLFPLPRVVLENVVTDQPQPVELRRLTLELDKSALWHRQLKVERAELQGAVLPQLSLRAWRLAPGADAQTGQPVQGLPAGFSVESQQPVARLEFQDVTWIGRHGTRVVYAGEAEFDAHWRPRTAALRRPGVQPAADLTLTRQGQQDRWDARINLGGGTAQGQLQLQSGTGAEALRLTGSFKPQGIEVSSAVAAFERHSIIAGRASGSTTLSASGASLPELMQSLRTTTSFTMGRATLLRFDVDKAIHSLGKDHAGSTVLESVTGQLDTHNTPQGMVVDYSRVQVRSGALSASGKARIANRRIDAEFAVDLVNGVVGVPLKLSGPLEHVQVSVPASAVAGAVVGTAVLPGIGTAIGARLGAALGRLFGEPDSKKKAGPAARQP